MKIYRQSASEKAEKEDIYGDSPSILQLGIGPALRLKLFKPSSIIWERFLNKDGIMILKTIFCVKN